MSDYQDRMDRNIRYSDGEMDIYLAVPWGEGSGNIPPPKIEFYVSQTGKTQTFIYQGS